MSEDPIIEMLASIQRLALTASQQTGRRVIHEVQGWGDGVIWSGVRAVDDDSEPLHQTTINVDTNSGREYGVMLHATEHALAEQRDALVDWIATNKQEEAA